MQHNMDEAKKAPLIHIGFVVALHLYTVVCFFLRSSALNWLGYLKLAFFLSLFSFSLSFWEEREQILSGVWQMVGRAKLSKSFTWCICSLYICTVSFHKHQFSDDKHDNNNNKQRRRKRRQRTNCKQQHKWRKMSGICLIMMFFY